MQSATLLFDGDKVCQIYQIGASNVAPQYEKKLIAVQLYKKLSTTQKVSTPPNNVTLLKMYRTTKTTSQHEIKKLQ